jgi:putative ABC transport system ATP-binding protein
VTTAAKPPARSLIEVVALTKEYRLGQQRIRALDDVSLTIGAGEFIAIMGASGSGKSTLLNAIGGLDHPTGGTIHVAGEAVTALDERGLSRYRRRRVGFVFQKFNLVGAYTARENVEFPLVFAGVPEATRRQKAEQALTAVGLGERQRHRPNELSGGQQQRVAVARALVHDPDILLADEPTGNLDSQTSGEIMALLRDICAGGRTILMVTHDERLAAYAHRVVVMRDGRIEQQTVTPAAPAPEPQLA